MQLTFKQGLVSHQPNFLQITNGDVFLSTTNTPTVVVVSHGQSDYLIIEPVRSVPKLTWNNIPTGTTSWLYWDINILTAEKTFGNTTIAPVHSINPPTVIVTDQHWFNTNTNKMYVWNGSNWSEKIRVFAAQVTSGSVIVLYSQGQSQASIYSTTYAGIILFDNSGKVIKKQNGTFLTSEDSMLMDSSVTYTTKTEAYSSYCFANEAIPAFSVVRVLPGNRVNLATYADSNEGVLSLVLYDVLYDEPVSVVFGGVITNIGWDWSVGSKLWVDDNGMLTATNPSVIDPGKQPQAPIAKAIAPDTIVFFPYGVTAVGGAGVPVQADVVDASLYYKGVSKLSVAPVSPANPIAVGTNDPRMTDARTPVPHTHSEIISQLTTHVLSPTHLSPTQQILLDGITVTSPNINTLAGVTTSVQQQINSKQNTLGYVPVDKAGDIMTGSLILNQDPTANLQAATKQYVDAAVSFTSGFFASPVQGIPELKLIPIADITDKQIRLVESAGAIFRYDTASGELPNDVTVVDPISSPAYGRWIKIQAATASHNTLIGIQGGVTDEYLHLSNLEKSTIDNHLINSSIHVSLPEKQLISGITLLASDINSIPTTMNLMQNAINGKQDAIGYVPVNKAGDTMGGPLMLDRDPTLMLQAATKRYVDETLASETVTVHSALTGLSADDHLQYALSDGTRGNFAATNHNHNTTYAPIVHNHSDYVQLIGDTMTGVLVLNADPVQDMQAATKHYVDVTIITDHGNLGGLSDDDHPQYLTNARGDARYYTTALADTTFAAMSHDHASITGNAGSATVLQTARLINGVPFDGSADITVAPVVDPYGPTTVESVAGKSGVVTLDKNDVGLSNVDDTSDVNKPVSDATQTALNFKSDISHNHDLVYEPINGNIQVHIASTLNPHNVTSSQVLPDQTGNTGKLLTTDGSSVSWGDAPVVVSSLVGLSDVLVTTPASGQALQFNGTAWVNTTPSVGVTDHGLLTGLADDDHPQYLNDTRGDVRYYTKTLADTTFAVTAHNHDLVYEPKNSNIQSHISSTSNPHNVTSTQVLPTQAGNTGKALMTDGVVADWSEINIDDVTGISVVGPANGQVLQFDGTNWINTSPVVGITDHGLLAGLDDDDHTQYLNNARGDVRYYTKTSADTTFAVTAHNHDLVYEPKNSNIQSHITSTSNPHNVTSTQVLPTQASNTGKVLMTDGTVATWSEINVDNVTGILIAGPTNGQILQFDGTDWINVSPVFGFTDHGDLAGLADDDHPQYLNDSRGDIRYYTKISADTTFAATVHDHSSITGNAATATTLATTRTINGVGFNGSANITINAVDSTSRIASTEKGAINGVATLDATGLVLSTQLPSYVDDVLEFADLAGFPVIGEQGKIYVALDTNKTYRWSGSVYVYITSGAVDSVAGKTGVVTLAKADVGLSSVDNTSDVNKPISTATQNALDLKSDTTHAHNTLYVSLSGSTMTGSLTLSGDPTINLHAATKQYVDAKVRYDIASGTVGQVVADDTILRLIAVAPYSFPLNLAGSAATAATGSSASYTFTIAKNGTQFATMTYVGTSVTFAGTATTFAAGDILTIVAPSTTDATLANMAYTLVASLL